MTVAPTRLLVMGAVRTFEPVNGYQIRRELISWNVQEWAHIQPGSIYSALSTLTNKGHLERHDLLDGGREVAVYTTTEAGRAEMYRQQGLALETVDPYARSEERRVGKEGVSGWAVTHQKIRGDSTR